MPPNKSTFGCVSHTSGCGAESQQQVIVRREACQQKVPPDYTGHLQNVEKALRELVAAMGALRIPPPSIAVIPPAQDPPVINVNVPEPERSPPIVNVLAPDLGDFIRFVKRAIIAAMILTALAGALLGARIAL